MESLSKYEFNNLCQFIYPAKYNINSDYKKFILYLQKNILFIKEQKNEIKKLLDQNKSILFGNIKLQFYHCSGLYDIIKYIQINSINHLNSILYINKKYKNIKDINKNYYKNCSTLSNEYLSNFQKKFNYNKTIENYEIIKYYSYIIFINDKDYYYLIKLIKCIDIYDYVNIFNKLLNNYSFNKLMNNYLYKIKYYLQNEIYNFIMDRSGIPTKYFDFIKLYCDYTNLPNIKYKVKVNICLYVHRYTLNIINEILDIIE